MKDRFEFAGKTVLITGASSGIGVEFARELASRGATLILVARRQELLDQHVREFARCFGTASETIAMDLATPQAGAELCAELERRQLSVDALINNAGFASYGRVAEADPGQLANEIQLNVGTLVDLTTRLLPPMVERASGAIINVASTGAFQPLPRMAVYGASKAFVLSFTSAVWEENRDSGVRVLALCPGATETPFFDKTGDQAAAGKKRDPRQVVETALRALDAGKPSVVDGIPNAAAARVGVRLMPQRLVMAVAGAITRPPK